jgi:L-alanine-DL-glutamate epimerase-like enolase superfamily enzyme
MKIQQLETFSDEFVCFVKLSTDSGQVGWGQTSTYNADISATIFHRQIAPWALGADALDIDGILQTIWEKEHKYPGSYRCRAMAGLDTAMWDLRGKIEGKPVVEGSVEAWARDEGNPVGGYYGQRKGYRGRFANYVPPLMEVLGLAEVEHNARGNRMRAL